MQQVLFRRFIFNELVLSKFWLNLTSSYKNRETQKYKSIKSILLEITDANKMRNTINDVTRATLVFARLAIAFVHLTFTRTLLFRAMDKSVASLIYIH